MGERIEPGAAGLLARKGEARSAVRPDNDNKPMPATVDAAVALAGGRRGSMTLRLDPSRHMGLRLACALDGRSAQAIVCAALDAYLQTTPGIGRLIAKAIADGGDQTATGWGSET